MTEGRFVWIQTQRLTFQYESQMFENMCARIYMLAKRKIMLPSILSNAKN